MSGSLVIHVGQLPPATSSPNARVHWAERKRDADIYAKAVFYECVQLRNNIEASSRQPFGPPYQARVDLTFIFPERRRRDPDNMVACFKPGLDAVVRSGLLSEDSADRISIGSVKIEVDPARAPETVIVLSDGFRRGGRSGTGKS